jgi:hypothetical protein
VLRHRAAHRRYRVTVLTVSKSRSLLYAHSLRSARRQFGNETRLQEISREMWGFGFVETLIQDVRYGIRVLVKHKGCCRAHTCSRDRSEHGNLQRR